MDGFHQETVEKASDISEDFYQKLNNGKTLSVYVDGVSARINRTGEII